MKIDAFRYIQPKDRIIKKPECKTPGRYTATIISSNMSGNYLYVNFDLGETSISSSFAFWVDDPEKVDKANSYFSSLVDACGIQNFDGETDRIRGKKLTITVAWDKNHEYLRVSKFEKLEQYQDEPEQDGFDYDTPPNFINPPAEKKKRDDGLPF